MRYRERKRRLLGPESLFEGERIFFEPGFVVYRYVMPGPVNLEGILLPEGSATYGFYWEDRPYNLYLWVDRKEKPRALYFNVSDSTRVGEEEVTWRDLMVDILYPVDGGRLGSPRVLDLEEGEGPLRKAGLWEYVQVAVAAVEGEAPRLYRWTLSFIEGVKGGGTARGEGPRSRG